MNQIAASVNVGVARHNGSVKLAGKGGSKSMSIGNGIGCPQVRRFDHPRLSQGHISATVSVGLP